MVVVLVQAGVQGRLTKLFRNSAVIAMSLAQSGEQGIEQAAETGRAVPARPGGRCRTRCPSCWRRCSWPHGCVNPHERTTLTSPHPPGRRRPGQRRGLGRGRAGRQRHASRWSFALKMQLLLELRHGRVRALLLVKNTLQGAAREGARAAIAASADQRRGHRRVNASLTAAGFNTASTRSASATRPTPATSPWRRSHAGTGVLVRSPDLGHRRPAPIRPDQHDQDGLGTAVMRKEGA
jgi:hypothetical protein